MPIVRYFVVVGTVLLSLLLALDHVAPPNPRPAAATDVDRSIIRISSTRPLPDKIVLDVAQPPAMTAAFNVDIAPDEPPPHDALAMMPPEHPAGMRQARAVTEPIAKRRRTARAPRSSRTIAERRLALEHRDIFAGW